MAFPRSPACPTVGGSYFRIGSSGVTPEYPDGTLAGATAVTAANVTINSKLLIVEGYVRESGGTTANDALVLVDDAGTDIDTYPASLGGAYLSAGAEGLELKSGIGARLAGAGTALYRIHYRIIHGPTYGEDA